MLNVKSAKPIRLPLPNEGQKHAAAITHLDYKYPLRVCNSQRNAIFEKFLRVYVSLLLFLIPSPLVTSCANLALNISQNSMIYSSHL